MSAIGLDTDHVADHFTPWGLCRCPCAQCTTRTAKVCVCLDCCCESMLDHDPNWVIQRIELKP